MSNPPDRDRARRIARARLRDMFPEEFTEIYEEVKKAKNRPVNLYSAAEHQLAREFPEEYEKLLKQEFKKPSPPRPAGRKPKPRCKYCGGILPE